MMKRVLYAIALLSIIYSCNNTKEEIKMPAPTEIYYGDEEGNANARQEWMDALHSAAPGVNWKDIEARNAENQAVFKHELRGSGTGEEITIGDGFLTGKWSERGSSNQAGSILITDYDVNTDDILAVSAGGTLWKGTINGNDWEVLNQDYRFGRNLLAHTYDDQGNRTIHADIGGVAHYSEDEGQTWTAAEGADTRSIYDAIRLEDETIILNARNRGAYISQFISKDDGRSYKKINTITTNDPSIISMTIDKKHENVFIIEQIGFNNSKIHQFKDDQFVTINAESTIGFGDRRANITSNVIDSTAYLYAYKKGTDFYVSTDTGKVWQKHSELPTDPWSVGIMSSAYNTSRHVMGAVEAFLLGPDSTWYMINPWYSYYNNVENDLHADVMHMGEYVDSEGKPFWLNSNHGGIYISYDYGSTNKNISLSNLNVGQFYDVRTDPNDPDNIYGGTQDQGYQKGIGAESSKDILELNQAISGDYGHLTFSQYGLRLWMVYPFGSVSYYHIPQDQNYPSAYYEIDSGDESVWIPPVVESPDETENAVYVAGGSVSGNGSHILKLTYTENEGIEATQLPYNFSPSGGQVSAIAFNHFDSNIIYAMTTNGLFYKSTDGGNNFSKLNIVLSGAHYLYGSCILPSKIDPNVIYISGSGYSNAPIYRSTDGGVTFKKFNDGMPNTTAFNIVSNPDETVLYAATEAGPYAMEIESGVWHYMGGADAPNTRFWSVEYVQQDDIDLVRFGTYGRGIWDFDITSQPSSTEGDLISSFEVYPNPASEYITIQSENDANEYTLIITDISGKVVQNSKIKSFQEISVKALESGTYFATLISARKYSTKKFIKI